MNAWPLPPSTVGPELGLGVAVRAACVLVAVAPALVVEPHAHSAINAPQPRPICTARDFAPNQKVKRFHCWLIPAMLCMLSALRRMLPSCDVRRIPRKEVTCRLRSSQQARAQRRAAARTHLHRPARIY